MLKTAAQVLYGIMWNKNLTKNTKYIHLEVLSKLLGYMMKRCGRLQQL